MTIYKADYVVPISSPPIKEGAVVEHGGRIEFVGKFSDAAEKYPDHEIEYIDSTAIIPGLVNCHMHLELTGFRGRLDDFDHDFGGWVVEITRLRREYSGDETIGVSALLGACEALASGVTCVGDIGRLGYAGMDALSKTGLRGVVFQETEFSPSNETAESDFDLLRRKHEDLAARSSGLVAAGISPHAPFTVSRSLFERIASYSIDNKIPISIHAAESSAEAALMKSGKGPFAETFMDESVDWDVPFLSTVDYFEKIGVLEAKPLLAHVIDVNEDELEMIAKSGASVAHCPRSNAKFGHGIAPVNEMIEKGVSVGLGSDSMASNNSCDLFSESAFACLVSRLRPGNVLLSAKMALRLATLGGAEAMGMENEIGSLEAGKQADLAVISVGGVGQTPESDIYSTLVFSTNASAVRQVIIAGETVFQDGRAARVDIRDVQERATAAFAVK